MSKLSKALHKIQDSLFRGIHNNNLVYNTCWEDPRCDRELMQLDQDSSIVMITSAGCNALDYLLDGPKTIACIDVNARQNALLEFKQAMFLHADHDILFQFFGEGRHPIAEQTYRHLIRANLSETAQLFWDKKIGYFSKKESKKTFYYRGTSGSIAWMFRKYINTKPKTKRLINELLAAPNLETQAEIYKKIEPKFLTHAIKWLMGRHITLSLVGVPRPQRELIRQAEGGFPGFIQECLRHVFARVPITDNYFWTVYLKGHYTKTCCPSYLEEGHFDVLKERVSRIQTHTMTLSQFLKEHPGQYSHYVLLDHQDWLAAHDFDALKEEWELILKNSRPGTRILMRSAAPFINFIPEFVHRAVEWENKLTASTHLKDRVGTYGSVHMGVVK